MTVTHFLLFRATLEMVIFLGPSTSFFAFLNAFPPISLHLLRSTAILAQTQTATYCHVNLIKQAARNTILAPNMTAA
jgi:hypothetical protein